MKTGEIYRTRTIAEVDVKGSPMTSREHPAPKGKHSVCMLLGELDEDASMAWPQIFEMWEELSMQPTEDNPLFGPWQAWKMGRKKESE